ncbi:hypothetical protein EV191_13030 [Tamaricihabitans halophyticus]|uniref:Uncharacterized protein n=1 Tax=Tamaricihabitans halophyticus TaxID=1262583 RepID=A0A4R2PTP5_9PSEU|nr:hypothetical protein EV191_13030 [Tamaricihabitans halophyticus]
MGATVLSYLRSTDTQLHHLHTTRLPQTCRVGIVWS